MPGPKMGPRPPDFDEELIRQSPTFIKWQQIAEGAPLRYACRDFIKGRPDDEERLMRRIMIARRNNIRDHSILKQARARRNNPLNKKRQRTATAALCDDQVAQEMDRPAVEATRSYRTWMSLQEGDEFVYNQKYIKGREGHDWLLRKNIWRRMRYRRENKKLLEKLKRPTNAPCVGTLSQQTHRPTDPGDGLIGGTRDDILEDDGLVDPIEAAMAVAENFQAKTAASLHTHDAMEESGSPEALSVVHNPLDVVVVPAALDAAARLAAAHAVETDLHPVDVTDGGINGPIKEEIDTEAEDLASSVLLKADEIVVGEIEHV